MKRIATFAAAMLMVSVAIACAASPVYGQSAGKVLMIVREGYSSDLDLAIEMEVGVMDTGLKNAGYEVEVASTSGQPILGPTQKIEKVSRLSEIKLSNYAGVIMPCMGVGMFPGPPVSSEAVAAVKQVLEDGKPVAAASNASIVLAEAGVLKGRKYAYVTDPLNPAPQWAGRTDKRFEGAIYGGPGVVQDGKIITSGICPILAKGLGLPNGTVELTKKFVAALGTK
ncbi:DJ-1/PfpI family protein [Bradyrhizobium sp.]|uniref:DJ-1/PfpI family protein n=1 Tax=Bradyrhizobium sp. TaxID=376 RepID=UPI003C628BE3